MPGVTLLFALVALALTVAGGLVLYWLVRSEHGGRTTTDRATAEAMARRDTDAETRRDGVGTDGESDERDQTDDAPGNHWG